MIEERRNLVYASTRRKHELDIHLFEGQPWVRNADTTWSKTSSMGNLTMTVSEDGIHLRVGYGLDKLYEV